MGREDEGKPQQPLPHYALPNFSVVLPTYSNNEADVITQAFRIGNYVSLSAMPNSIKPGQVSRSRFQKILDNRQPAEDWNVSLGAPYKAKAKTFSEFEYISSPFSLADDLAKEERERSQKATADAGHTTPWVMSDTQIKLKYEDGANPGWPGNPGFQPNPAYSFNAYISTADPYERADDQSLRFKWLQDAQILSGPFRPSGRVKGQTGQASSELPTRSTLPQMVAELREAIEADWGEYAFLVCSTDDEHVVVRFELSTLDSEPGLGAYMNVFARSHHVVSKFMLRKVVEDWNVTPGDDHVYFTFRPPWVTSRITDTFFSLHPEQRNYQDPRLKRRNNAAARPAGGTSSIGDGAGASFTSATGSGAAGASGEVVRPDLT
uniref:Uncharacterized protein n=1 Tax=Haptolina brevifila TaxID=156173 RepID=A0A7S2IBN6_9EUKA|mmetsp:Transcript_64274/g.127002  ORF Transcript_64274/g.127002 Transcript_64274/m.127002 type:complete len:378 (+) Transcript_64274:84-1217(+)